MWQPGYSHLSITVCCPWSYEQEVNFSLVNNLKAEVVYLMLSEIFDRLKYRRVEWKCDALNARSRAAALKLGFSFEGIFRQHFIIKNRNRDAAWFAMMDKDWSDKITT